MTHYHFIGISGTGLSAIARVLLENGHTVSGSDRILSPLATSLAMQGAVVWQGHRGENVSGADWVIRSSAIPDDNPEVLAAQKAGIPVLKRAEFLGELMKGKRVLAVAGTHGKTTTTAMLAWVLTALGEDPSYIVGGVLQNTGSNAHAGKGSTFVIEADEYDRMFLGLKPDIAIVTFIEHDHPDCFPTPGAYLHAFQEFIDCMQPDGMLVACADNPAGELVRYAHDHDQAAITYALHTPADYLAKNLSRNQYGGFSFSAHTSQSVEPFAQVSLQVPGEHNVLNALAVLATIQELGLNVKQSAQALGEFSGTGRRFELRGDVGGITIVDDYAHHPTEIRTTLAAARQRFLDRRIWAVWQPHTYSRTRALQAEFSQAFQDADRVIVMEIYAAREAPENYSSATIAAAIPNQAATYSGSLPRVVETLKQELLPGDVVLVLSAGDADQVSTQLVEWLRGQEGQA